MTVTLVTFPCCKHCEPDCLWRDSGHAVACPIGCDDQ